jgi:hypothetical protein
MAFESRVDDDMTTQLGDCPITWATDTLLTHHSLSLRVLSGINARIKKKM